MPCFLGKGSLFLHCGNSVEFIGLLRRFFVRILMLFFEGDAPCFFEYFIWVFLREILDVFRGIFIGCFFGNLTVFFECVFSVFFVGFFGVFFGVFFYM